VFGVSEVPRHLHVDLEFELGAGEERPVAAAEPQ
jgi:hypothetical protein